MTQPAIKVEGLYKEYVVGHAHERHDTFYELLTSALKAPLKRLRNLGGQSEEKERFWALQDVNFEVQPGEVVGIIGRNGAGKSTLLKILSRITAPSKGRIEVRGRLASLLEVGTGFHPELSGRENIFLNGAILGMSQNEVACKFDEIVAFAEVAKFIDTPVKRYSSGMYVRLAFAVAAHLDPEILIIDEVLAVGDAEFQKKCLGTLDRIANDGRTVLIVSHNLRTISDLCTRAILMQGGQLVTAGPASDIVRQYLATGTEDCLEWRPAPVPGAPFAFNSVRIETRDATLEDRTISYLDPFDLVFDYTVAGDLAPGRLAFQLINEDGITVLASAETDTASSLNRAWPNGRATRRCTIPGRLLAPGRYQIVFAEPTEAGVAILRENLLAVTISEFGSPSVRDGRKNVISPMFNWKN